MPELTLSQAAKLSGKGKSTLHRAIKSGRLSASRKDDGTFGIDPSELLRAFPRDAVRPVSDRPNGSFRSPVDPGAERAEINALRDDLAAALQAAAVADAERRAAEALAEERARALDAAERHLADLRRLLPSSPAPVGSRSWWRFWH
jgi:hypothetical protein